MEIFYFLFESIENWDIWSERGFTLGFLVLFASTLLFLSLYYILIGRKTMSYATLGKWFLFGLVNAITVFIVTMLVEGFSVFKNTSVGDFGYEVWLFTMVNTLYAFVLYVLLSLLFKRFSIHSKFIPVKF